MEDRDINEILDDAVSAVWSDVKYWAFVGATTIAAGLVFIALAWVYM